MSETSASTGLLSGRTSSSKSPGVVEMVLEIVVLAVTTAVLLLHRERSLLLATAILTCGLGNLPNADQFGFLNATPSVLNSTNPIGPAGWTFAIWASWQVLFMLYVWSFVFCPNTPRTVS